MSERHRVRVGATSDRQGKTLLGEAAPAGFTRIAFGPSSACRARVVVTEPGPKRFESSTQNPTSEGPQFGYLLYGRTARGWPVLSRGVRRVALNSAARSWLGVALSWRARGVRTVGHRGRGEAQEGSAQLEVALPSSSTNSRFPDERSAAMGRVVIGMDPHKRSATIEVLDERERVISTGPVRHRWGGLPQHVGRGAQMAAANLGGRRNPGRRAASRAAPGRRQRGRRGCASQAVRARSGVLDRTGTGRPTPPTRTQSRSWRCALPTCGWSRLMTPLSRCACWSTAAMSSAAPAR